MVSISKKLEYLIDYYGKLSQVAIRLNVNYQTLYSAKRRSSLQKASKGLKNKITRLYNRVKKPLDYNSINNLIHYGITGMDIKAAVKAKGVNQPLRYFLDVWPKDVSGKRRPVVIKKGTKYSLNLVALYRIPRLTYYGGLVSIAYAHGNRRSQAGKSFDLGKTRPGSESSDYPRMFWELIMEDVLTYVHPSIFCDDRNQVLRQLKLLLEDISASKAEWKFWPQGSGAYYGQFLLRGGSVTEFVKSQKNPKQPKPVAVTVSPLEEIMQRYGFELGDEITIGFNDIERGLDWDYQLMSKYKKEASLFSYPGDFSVYISRHGKDKRYPDQPLELYIDQPLTYEGLSV